jgi:hypothetical protein
LAICPANFALSKLISFKKSLPKITPIERNINNAGSPDFVAILVEKVPIIINNANINIMFCTPKEQETLIFYNHIFCF